MYIQRLHHEEEFSKVLESVNTLIKETGWDNVNQISLKHRAGATDIFRDGVGSLYNKSDREFTAKESEFSLWSLPEDNPLVKSIKSLEVSQNFTTGRVRIMRLLPKTGLSVHNDLEVRYHLAIQTNKKSFFCWNKPDAAEILSVKAICYHIPKDEHWYYADTRLTHWIYNGGDTERIHLVVCANK